MIKIAFLLSISTVRIRTSRWWCNSVCDRTHESGKTGCDVLSGIVQQKRDYLSRFWPQFLFPNSKKGLGTCMSCTINYCTKFSSAKLTNHKIGTRFSNTRPFFDFRFFLTTKTKKRLSMYWKISRTDSMIHNATNFNWPYFKISYPDIFSITFNNYRSVAHFMILGRRFICAHFQSLVEINIYIFLFSAVLNRTVINISTVCVHTAGCFEATKFSY